MCGKYDHKPVDQKSLENKNEKGEKIRKQKRMKIKIKNLMGYATIATEKGI